MNRFLDPVCERNLDGVEAAFEFDVVELEPGHKINIELSGDFVWDGWSWSADRLHLHTFRHDQTVEDVIYAGAGNPIKTIRNKLVEGALRIDDRSEFKWLVDAAERWATEHYDPAEYV
jgi:hypothetical protein